jgi:lysophospholipase L1-like esterase
VLASHVVSAADATGAPQSTADPWFLGEWFSASPPKCAQTAYEAELGHWPDDYFATPQDAAEAVARIYGGTVANLTPTDFYRFANEAVDPSYLIGLADSPCAESTIEESGKSLTEWLPKFAAVLYEPPEVPSGNTTSTPGPSSDGGEGPIEPPPVKKTTLAALGDSYSSGEGAGDYDAEPLGCHRSADAWPRLLGKLDSKIEEVTLLACSGATSGTLAATQLAELSAVEPAPTVVTLTMGGNDVGFSEVLKECYAYYVYNCVKDGLLGKVAHRIAAESSLLVSDYEAVKEAAPSATLVVVDYPQLLPNRQKEVNGCNWLTDQKRVGLLKLNQELDNSVAEAAGEAGAQFINVYGALKGHELCSHHPWLYPIGLDGVWNAQDGHPTFFGQLHIEMEVDRRLDSLLGGS